LEFTLLFFSVHVSLFSFPVALLPTSLIFGLLCGPLMFSTDIMVSDIYFVYLRDDYYALC
jgi:hypothetical protein